ncbi:MAG: NADH-quinone oxidoreductase subunit J [Planctomycetota bacterium]
MSPVLAHTLFIVSAIAAVLSALLVVTRRNPIYSALFLILFFGAITLDFLLLEAQFLAFMQLLVYAGAIMVLYLFVIMLINPREGDLPDEGGFIDKGIAAGVAALTFCLLGFAISRSPSVGERAAFPALPPVAETHGGVAAFGAELTSILILIGIIGAVHLALRARRTGDRAQAGGGAGRPEGAAARGGAGAVTDSKEAAHV